MRTAGIPTVGPGPSGGGAWAPAQANAAPAAVGGESGGFPVSSGPDFGAIQNSAEFAALRSRLRRFIFPMTLVFLGWYLTYVMLAAFAPGFMGTPALGLINIGMLLGLAQFATTLLITFSYNAYARRRLDPQVELVRNRAGIGRA